MVQGELLKKIERFSRIPRKLCAESEYPNLQSLALTPISLTDEAQGNCRPHIHWISAKWRDVFVFSFSQFLFCGICEHDQQQLSTCQASDGLVAISWRAYHPERHTAPCVLVLSATVFPS